MSTFEDVKYNEEAFCEHCYELEPYTAVIEIGADYCIDCAEHSGDVELSEEDLQLIAIVETLYKAKYYRSRYESASKDLMRYKKTMDDNVIERLKQLPPIGEL